MAQEIRQAIGYVARSCRQLIADGLGGIEPVVVGFMQQGDDTIPFDATDTGNKLAEGSYSYTDQSNVSISVTSLIRQTTTQVNCAMVTQTQLNCTSSAGSQFSLVRRASGVS